MCLFLSSFTMWAILSWRSFSVCFLWALENLGWINLAPKFKAGSSTDCNFQGFSRRWIFILKFKDFQDACQPYSTLPSTDTFVWRVRRSCYRHSQEMTNSELLLSWKTWDTDTGWRSGEIELDKLTQIDENFVTKNIKKKIQTERVPTK